MSPPPRLRPGILPGILPALFLVSLGSLALEILQMRIFAFSLWHHLAFLVVSIAILGFGAAGAVLSVLKPLQRADLGVSMAAASILFGLSALAGPFFLAGGTIDLFSELGWPELSRIALYYLVFALPYFFAGWIVSLALTRETRFVGKLYFVNLLGSGLGCFLLFAVLEPFGAEGSLFLIAAFGGLAAALSTKHLLFRSFGASLTLVALCCAPFGSKLLKLEVAGSKLLAVAERLRNAKGEPMTETLVTRWTPLSRIDVTRNPAFDGLYIFQDGDAPAPMPSLQAPLQPDEIHGIAYSVLEKPKVLIIGVGGGFDVKVALLHGAREVTGVEINPTTLRLYEDERWAGISGRTWERPEVRLEVGEGRHFVRRSPEKYDLIQMSGVDTYTALASGAYVLSESYLYTREAFRDYLEHLTDRGLFAIIRFAFPAPRETLRIMVMACEALRDLGASEPWKHIAVLRGGIPEATKNPFTKVTGLGAILVKKTPFTKAQLDALRAWASQGDQTIRDYLPDEEGRFTESELATLRALISKDPRYKHYQIGAGGMNPFHAYARALKQNNEGNFLASYPYDVRPVHDDAPFFFSHHRFRDALRWILGKGDRIEVPKDAPWVAQSPLFQTRPTGLLLLFLTLGQLAILVLLLIFVPLLFLRRSAEERGSPWPAMGYFAYLGLAYILLMVSAMQRFGLVVGHPTYSIPLVMATFLIGSGLGSLASGFLAGSRPGRLLALVAVALCLGTLALQLWLPALTEVVLPKSFATRALVTVALLAPFAFLMGTCFPTGLRLLAAERPSLVPWAYGVNGAMSVLGSVVAVLLAMTLGFTGVQWISAGLYVLAALLLPRIG